LLQADILPWRVSSGSRAQCNSFMSVCVVLEGYLVTVHGGWLARRLHVSLGDAAVIGRRVGECSACAVLNGISLAHLGMCANWPLWGACGRDHDACNDGRHAQDMCVFW
jgi:hypothetical protein